MNVKICTIAIISLFLLSCSGKKLDTNDEVKKESDEFIVKEDIQDIFDAANIHGATLVYDAQNESYYSNNFKWCREGKLPASTFKIPNSIIALETGVVDNASTNFKWNGERRALENWEQDLSFKDAFHFSCVPCYQEVARKIGVDTMIAYLDKLDYADIVVDSATIDDFWLIGKSRINQFQQIDFLQRFYQSELPLSERTEKIMKDLMVIEQSENYKLSGKTGWSNENGHDNGWFVGYVEMNNNVFYFATNVEPTKQFDMAKFAMIRKELTHQVLQEMKIMP